MLTRERYFEQLLLGKSIQQEDWLGKLRLDAHSTAKILKFPSERHEDWRLTDLTAMLQHEFHPVDSFARITMEDIAALLIPGSIRMVFVDGSYDAGLSDLSLADKNVVIGQLAERLGDAQVRTHFARHLDFANDAFAALNTSQFDDGAWVQVSGELDVPIHILNVATKRDRPSALYPRALVLIEAHSRAALIEDYAGTGEGVSFSNAVTEIVLQDHAQLQHVRVQREAQSAFHLGHCAVTANKDSSYTSTSLSFGARVSRLAMRAALKAEGARVTLNGLALTNGRQIADTHTLIDHMVARCRSRQLHKCIADGASHAVFSGRIIVRPGASGTDSEQTSRNLLLSGKAHIDAQPQLEIFNDDVSCKHGATIGQIDEEALFFLKSRGFNEASARNLLTHAFAEEIINRIPVPELAASLSHSMLKENP